MGVTGADRLLGVQILTNRLCVGAVLVVVIRAGLAQGAEVRVLQSVSCCDTLLVVVSTEQRKRKWEHTRNNNTIKRHQN